MDQPRPFFIYFWSFQTNNTISQQTNVKNVMSIQYTMLYTAVYGAVSDGLGCWIRTHDLFNMSRLP